MYLTENWLVQNPSWNSAKRFFTEILEPSSVRGYYQPLTMISLMLDCAVGGSKDNLVPFHRTSLTLHICNTILVIVLLYLLLGNAFIAAGIGLLFGVNPIPVELICWISDRKDLLASFFSFLCLILYLLYAKRSNWKFYVGCIATYILALMSKPTSTPIPVLMLLLDFWPLKRINKKAILEKLPFFALGVISAFITTISQGRTSPIIMPSNYGIKHIILVICHNIAFYLDTIFRPVKLSLFYPYPESLTLTNPTVLTGVIYALALILLLAVSLKWTRVLLTGWLIFFIAILPTMNIIGFTYMIAADRYIYLPSIGILIIFGVLFKNLYGTNDKTKIAAQRTMVFVLFAVLASAEFTLSRKYVQHWQDSIGLHRYMLEIYPNAASLQGMLGMSLAGQGFSKEAIDCYQKALNSDPNDVETHINIGYEYQQLREIDKAVMHYEKALEIKPNQPNAHNNLGNALKAQGKFTDAIEHYKKALAARPEYTDALYNLAETLQKTGQIDDAVQYYQRLLKLAPKDAETYYNLGLIFSEHGKLEEGICYFQTAVEIKPDYALAHCNLGYAYQLQGKIDKAIEHYRKAIELKPDYQKAEELLADVLTRKTNPK